MVEGSSGGKFTLSAATAVVIGAMVGTGVFTSLGFQLQEFHSGFVLMLLWVIGGVCALCGAMTYAELAAAMPRSGGEYNFLRQLYHPAAGFIGGWVSATVGFSAPLALVAITLGEYVSVAWPAMPTTVTAIVVIVVATLFHSLTHRTSGNFQSGFTFIKIALIALFCVVAWLLVETPQPVDFSPSAGDGTLILSGGFAVSLIYVNYAYLGWNSATYIADELRTPSATISTALLVGTGLVMALYLLLNFIFLYVAPISEMEGQIEIGYVAAHHAFGEHGALIISVAFGVLLVSTVSSFTLAGPRVLYVVGQDYSAFKWLAKVNEDGVPFVAIVVQSIAGIAFVLTGTFESILVVAGFTMTLTVFVTVLGVFKVRHMQETHEGYRMPLYPLPPLVFLTICGWTLVYLVGERVEEALVAFGLIGSGLVLYFVAVRFSEGSAVAGSEKVEF